jgi:tellurite methyltransferase
MASNLAEWDEKHRAAAGAPPAEPASIVRELLPLLPRGLVLDLACGLGRHALLLAAQGQRVVAIDASAVAMETVEKRAHSAHWEVRHFPCLDDAIRSHAAGIHLLQANLDEIVIPASSFQLIFCFQYLQRSLFRPIEYALLPGGILLFETFTRAQLALTGGPRNPEHLLEPGELRTAFPTLHTLFYRELSAGQGIASLAAQKPV